MSGRAQDDKVIGVAHQHGLAPLLRVVHRPIQRVEVEVGQQGRNDPALRYALPVGQDVSFALAFLHHRRVQPLADEVQQAPVARASRHQFHQPVMGNGVEVFRQIRIHHFQPSAAQCVDDFVEGLMGVASGSKPIRARMEVRLVNRSQHQQRRHLHHPVFDRWYAQWPLTAAAFGYVNPPHRRGPVALGLHLLLQGGQPAGLPLRCCRDLDETFPVHTGRTPIAHDQPERVLQQVAPCQFSVEAPKPVIRFGLGLAIERVLEVPELFRGCYLLRAISRSFSPRRRLRTSSVPWRRAQVSPRLRVQRPEIEPVVLVATTNASDCGTDARRLTGPTGLRGGLSLRFPLAHRLRSPRFICGCPSRRACHADPAGDGSG